MEMLIQMEGGSEKGHAAKAMKVAAAMQGVETRSRCRHHAR
jgi:hypothetical protein